MLGGYSGSPRYRTTVLEGIRARVGSGVDVRYAEGCGITIGGSWNDDQVLESDPDYDHRLIQEAVAIARDVDVIVLAIGGNEQTSREAWSRTHLGDRTSLDLIGRQEDLARALVATGRPVVACLFNGRPNSICWLSDHVPAILECWYLGQDGGRALAEVLFGDVNPGGKLPITIPRSVGHLPAFYNHKPSARRGYLFDDVSPLYPFGFGLSYTTFALANPRLERARIAASEDTRVLVEVTNTGRRAGSEVVQVYVRDDVSSVTRPVKELKGFHKLWLDPGESRTVAIDLTPDAFAVHDIRMRYRVEPGTFTIMVGTSSRDADLAVLTLHVTP
jgi:beta-glucosidase